RASAGDGFGWLSKREGGDGDLCDGAGDGAVGEVYGAGWGATGVAGEGAGGGGARGGVAGAGGGEGGGGAAGGSGGAGGGRVGEGAGDHEIMDGGWGGA